MKNLTSRKWSKWNIGCSGFLIVVLLFIAYGIVVVVLNYGKYSLRPEESVKIEVKPLPNQPDHSTDLTIDNKNGAKLELGMLGNTSRYWIEYTGKERNKLISYDTETQKVTSYNGDLEENKEKELENSTKRDIYLKGRNLTIQAKGERTFNASSHVKYYITIKNLSNKTAHFEARVISR